MSGPVISHPMFGSHIVRLELPGRPQPKGRPRFANGRTYTDARTAAAEQSILAAWLTQSGQPAPHDGPVAVDMEFVDTPPQSWPKWRIQAALDRQVWPTGRPDLDNLVKILDGLNGVAWLDDAQVVDIRARRAFGPVPVTRVILWFGPKPVRVPA
jgi:Holliday junction resolvase RusA-like endonuclease